MDTSSQAYRQQLDSMPIDATAADRMVAEANQAFDLNTRLFHELDVLSGRVVVRRVVRLSVPVVVSTAALPVARSGGPSDEAGDAVIGSAVLTAVDPGAVGAVGAVDVGVTSAGGR